MRTCTLLAGLVLLLLTACARHDAVGPPWYAGDTHIHGHGCGGSRPPRQLVDLMVGAGLSVGSALIWGQGYDEDVAHFTGRDSSASTPETVLRYDLEVSGFPSDATGHLIALGLQDIGFPRRPNSLPIAEWAVGQGALVGMAHAQMWPPGYAFPATDSNAPYEFPVGLALGRLHFLETEALETNGDPLPPGARLLWTSLLNSGFKVPVVAASDFPCMAFPALDSESVRTYVQVYGPFSYDAWLDGIRGGRTVVARGARDFLAMTVDGADIGSELRLPEGGDTVEFEVETHLRDAATVSIVVNGHIVAEEAVEASAGQRFSGTIRVSDSSWIAAHAPRVQTGATYLVVGGRPIRVSERDPRYFVGYIDHLLSIIDQGGLVTVNGGPEEARAEIGEIRRDYLRAREVFERRAAEALGR